MLRFLRTNEFRAAIRPGNEAGSEGTVVMGGVGGGSKGSGFENLLRPQRLDSRVSTPKGVASLARMIESGRGAGV